MRDKRTPKDVCGEANLKVTLNNTRKEDWLNINMYVSG